MHPGFIGRAQSVELSGMLVVEGVNSGNQPHYDIATGPIQVMRLKSASNWVSDSANDFIQLTMTEVTRIPSEGSIPAFWQGLDNLVPASSLAVVISVVNLVCTHTHKQATKQTS